MDFMKNFYSWRDDEFFDRKTRQELQNLDEETDEKEIEDRFYTELKFGTAGMRGKMGAGTNRMNIYTVGKAASAYGVFLQEHFGENVCRSSGVVVAFDTRENSSLFAKITARVLSGLGLKVMQNTKPCPVPELSYSIKKTGAIGGVMITASHNPKEYNGFKTYDENGAQLRESAALRIEQLMRLFEFYDQIDFVGDENLIEYVDFKEDFVNAIVRQSVLKDKLAKSRLSIVYTPLHGAGYASVVDVLGLDGFTNLSIVREQTETDGQFSTVKSPNPEDRDALKMGIELAEKMSADIVIGTDPDADRVGVAVRQRDSYKLLTGNQIGALMVDFLLSETNLSKMNKPAIVKSIVTSDLGAKIAKKRGVTVIETLTGFKYIGEKITEFETAKQIGNTYRSYDFLFGYEESYGYLYGTHARDKDAVSAAMIISEMAAREKSLGKTLLDRLDELYEEFGYSYDAQTTFTLEGKEGAEKIIQAMQKLRLSSSPFYDTVKVIDYSTGVEVGNGFGSLPISNVLKYVLGDGTWIAIRPSGTEPKLKVYYSCSAQNEREGKMYKQKLELALKVRFDF